MKTIKKIFLAVFAAYFAAFIIAGCFLFGSDEKAILVRYNGQGFPVVQQMDSYFCVIAQFKAILMFYNVPILKDLSQWDINNRYNYNHDCCMSMHEYGTGLMYGAGLNVNYINAATPDMFGLASFSLTPR